MRDWLVPDWPAPAGVRAVCTTRSGGTSQGAFGGLNLGGHVGDEAEHVAVNRAQFRTSIGVRPVFLQQVHGTDVLPIHATTPDGAVADACTTIDAGIACTIMVADCLPVLFTDREG
ncbi:MAG: laccase domain-containing protein, partial [Variovorax sp.]